MRTAAVPEAKLQAVQWGLDQLELDQWELDHMELDQWEPDQQELDQRELDQQEQDQRELDQLEVDQREQDQSAPDTEAAAVAAVVELGMGLKNDFLFIFYNGQNKRYCKCLHDYKLVFIKLTLLSVTVCRFFCAGVYVLIQFKKSE